MNILGNQLHPVVQILFPNHDAIFKDDNWPIHTPRSVQSWFLEHEDALKKIPWPAHRKSVVSFTEQGEKQIPSSITFQAIRKCSS
jgi:hypothetical protein